MSMRVLNLMVLTIISLSQVETINGYRDLHIPPGTQPGEMLKLPNMGVPNMKKPSVRGDHHFVVKVEIPKDIRFSFQISKKCFLMLFQNINFFDF